MKKLFGSVLVVLALMMILVVPVLAAPNGIPAEAGEPIAIADIDFESLMIIAVLIEAVVETVKWTYEPTDKPTRIKRFLALGVAIVMTILVNIDLFAMLGLKLSVPYVGALFTGVLMARGATVFHSIIKMFGGIADRLVPKQ